METIATSSAQIIQNSAMTQFFLGTGMIFWGFICLIGIITVTVKAWKGFYPKKVKGIK